MAKVDVKVPQKDGEISIVRDGDIDNPIKYKVTDGKVSVDEADAAAFLVDVNGAELVGGKAAAEAVADAATP